MSQSSRSTMAPKMSEKLSFRAPDCQRYSRLAVRSVTACVSSCAVTSFTGNPSPYTIWVPSQNAFW